MKNNRKYWYYQNYNVLDETWIYQTGSHSSDNCARWIDDSSERVVDTIRVLNGK